MKILVTGAKGFIGQNLCAALREIQLGHDRREDRKIEIQTIYEFGRTSTQEELEQFCSDCDFVFHLAGVNRPKRETEFVEGNINLVSTVLNTLKRQNNTCPVVVSSSIQACLTGRYAGNPYSESKRAGEELAFRYMRETGADVMVYRFPNVFGKWCRPNYNSAIATFCYNAAHDLPIQVNDLSTIMDVVYIDDLIEEMIHALQGRPNRDSEGCCTVPVHYETTLGVIADTILSFPKMREKLEVPSLDHALTKKLYSTYLSYLPAEKLLYDLHMNRDERGSFTEVLRTEDRGQVSVNIFQPGVTKGNHWHHTKNEKLIVVKGEALIRLRRVGTQPDGSLYPVTEFKVSGSHIQVVELIPGYTHSIVNCSDSEEMVSLIWANEPFDGEKPDTFFHKV